MKTAKKIILIVDDSIHILERLISLLELMDNIQCIVHAGSYNEASELLEQITPDLALLDIHLPGKSGIDLLRMIKEKHRDIKVCMFSNQANEFYRKTCKKIGASHFIDKSMDFDLLPGIIANTVAS